jgi:hypothetical protein
MYLNDEHIKSRSNQYNFELSGFGISPNFFVMNLFFFSGEKQRFDYKIKSKGDS